MPRPLPPNPIIIHSLSHRRRIPQPRPLDRLAAPGRRARLAPLGLLPALGPKHLVKPRSLVRAPTSLLLLQIRQPLGLGVNVRHLSLPRRIKLHHLLARRRARRLFKIRPQPAPQRAGAPRQAVGAVGRPRPVRGVHARVERLQGAEEALGDAVLLVERDGALQARVGDEVAVREVLSQNTGAGFFFLGDFVRVARGVGGVVVGVVVVGGGVGGRDGDFRGAELGVVEEEGGLGGGFLFKGDGRGLGLAGGGDGDGGDFAAGGGGGRG